MKQDILKIAGVKDEKSFYKKFPSEEAFMKVHGKEFKKAKMGAAMVKKQLTQLTDFSNPPQAQYGWHSEWDQNPYAEYKQPSEDDEIERINSSNLQENPMNVPSIEIPYTEVPVKETKRSASNNYSVVDFLNSKGLKSDYNTRKSLAQQYGIANYRGTAEQNLKLLDKLKGGAKSTNKTSEASYNPNDGNILRKGYTEPSFDNRDVSFKTGKENKPSQNKQKRKLSAAEQYIANDPYFFADEGDNALIMALDAPFTELRNLGARVALDKDAGALLQLLATGALSNMLPKTKILPYTPPAAGEIAASQTAAKAIPYTAKAAAEAYARWVASKTLPSASSAVAKAASSTVTKAAEKAAEKTASKAIPYVSKAAYEKYLKWLASKTLSNGTKALPNAAAKALPYATRALPGFKMGGYMPQAQDGQRVGSYSSIEQQQNPEMDFFEPTMVNYQQPNALNSLGAFANKMQSAQNGIDLPDIDQQFQRSNRDPMQGMSMASAQRSAYQQDKAMQPAPEPLSKFQKGWQNVKKEVGEQKDTLPGKIIDGVQQIQQDRQNELASKQGLKVSDLTLQATNSPTERVRRKYVRPEDMSFAPNQMGNPTGTGYNPLARDGAEIQNTYDPNDIYTDSGYEPLNDSDIEQFNMGGFMSTLKNYGKKAGSSIMGGLKEMGAEKAGGVGQFAGSWLGGGKGQTSGAGQLGSTAGGVIGSAFGPLGKIAGSAIGGAIGGVIGGAQAKRTAGNIAGMQNNMFKGAMSQNIGKQMRNQYSAFAEDGMSLPMYEEGGWMNPEYNPQVITKFGDHDVNDLFSPDPMMDTLRAGGSISSSPYRQPSERAMQTFAMGGELETHWGGKAEPISYNPYLPDGGETVMFRGQSHEEADGQGRTGIGVTYGDNPVEVERGEPAVKLKNGGEEENLVVFGNMKIPKYGVDELKDKNAEGKKFKHYANHLSKIENKQNKNIEKSLKMMNDLDEDDSFDQLKLASARVTINGSNMILKDIAQKKQLAAGIQNAILDTAKENGLESDALSRGMIKPDEQSEYARDGIQMAQNGASLAQKFSSVKEKALKKAQALYPGKKVEVREMSGDRDIDTQAGLRASGASRTDVSIHNLGGAKDFGIFVDGEFITDPSVYKKTTHAAAKEAGLYALNWQKDPFHISAVQEGGKNTYANLIKQYPEVKDSFQYRKTLRVLNRKGAEGDWTPTEKRAYEQLTGKVYSGIKTVDRDYSKTTPLYPNSPYEFDVPTAPQRPGLPIAPIDYERPRDVPVIKGTPPTTPIITVPGVPQKPKGPGFLNSLIPYLKPTDQEALDPNQLYPEMASLAMNNLEPVQAQLYNPQLETPYSVSLQDQLNANQADFNAIQRQVGYNPAAAASLAAQKYAANSSVLGQQERLNTAAKMEAYNRNRATLNDAQIKNLGILDTQYQRQSQAKSNTKEQALTALNSISSKIAQNKLENRRLGINENLYNYRYDKNGRAINYNAPANFQTDNLVANSDVENSDLLPIYDPTGKTVTGYKSSPKAKADNTKKTARNGSIVKAFKQF